MKLRILAAGSVCAFALGLPTTAAARHHGHRHGAAARQHKRHAHHARVLHFGAPAAASPAGAGAQPNAGPTGSSADERAGTVASFENGVLTIALEDGSTVSGKVTNQTRLRCEPVAEDAQSGDDGGEGDHDGRPTESDRSQTGGDDSPGDDEGGDDDQGDEQARESCATAVLVPGAVVREAELELGGAGAVWEQIELPGS